MPDPPPLLELFFCIPIVIPFKYIMCWVSLESLLAEMYCFTAFAKMTFPSDRVDAVVAHHRGPPL